MGKLDQDPSTGLKSLTERNLIWRLILDHRPLAFAVLLFWSVVFVMLALSLIKTQSHLIYTLDDTYIHMALAKNYARHGVWGIDRSGFSSASSSPLWTFLLSLIYRLPVNMVVIPFALNFVMGSLLLVLVYLMTKKTSAPTAVIYAITALSIFYIPLPWLAFCGQEHTLQVALVMCFIYVSVALISANSSDGSKGRGPRSKVALVLVLSPLMTSVRYEALLVVIVTSALLAAKRRLALAGVVLGLSLVPIFAYGLVSLSKGWYFLPNSLLLKGRFARIDFLKDLLANPHCLDTQQARRIFLSTNFLILIGLTGFLAYMVCAFRPGGLLCKARKSILALAVFVATCMLHSVFVGGLSFLRYSLYRIRYDAYLVGAGIVALIFAIEDLLTRQAYQSEHSRRPSQSIAWSILVFCFLLPFSYRVGSLTAIPSAAKNIFEQQYQMAQFLREFYQGQKVAVNDIGAVNFFANIDCIDLWGLADIDFAGQKRCGSYNSQNICELCEKKGVRIAIVYDDWYKQYGGLPQAWKKVGVWRIEKNIICGSDSVCFYCVDPCEEQNLIQNLRSFSQRLPPDVTQSGPYLDDSVHDSRQSCPILTPKGEVTARTDHAGGKQAGMAFDTIGRSWLQPNLRIKID